MELIYEKNGYLSIQARNKRFETNVRYEHFTNGTRMNDVKKIFEFAKYHPEASEQDIKQFLKENKYC